ncbi:hypothetical protein Tco_0218041 [Tanacetum coccineum]
MADNRTMRNYSKPHEGYEDAIVIPEITANNFEIKHGLLNLVQNKQFFGNDKEDPHAHIRYFNKITSTMKIPNVPNTSVKLMLFPFSLEGADAVMDGRTPRNEITRFQQKFDETFYEAWDRFNDLLRGCPHHGFSELHQLDTFYNALTQLIRFINSVWCSSTPAVSSDVAELKDMVRALILDRKNQTPVSAPVKAVEQSCVTCGGDAMPWPISGASINLMPLFSVEGSLSVPCIPQHAWTLELGGTVQSLHQSDIAKEVITHRGLRFFLYSVAYGNLLRALIPIVANSSPTLNSILENFDFYCSWKHAFLALDDDTNFRS